jgi:hypothetical protein
MADLCARLSNRPLLWLPLPPQIPRTSCPLSSPKMAQAYSFRYCFVRFNLSSSSYCMPAESLVLLSFLSVLQRNRLPQSTLLLPGPSYRWPPRPPLLRKRQGPPRRYRRREWLCAWRGIDEHRRAGDEECRVRSVELHWV